MAARLPPKALHLRKDLQRSDTTLGSIKMFTYQSSSASLRARLGHLEVNQKKCLCEHSAWNISLRKKGSKRVIQLSPLDNYFWFPVEPFWFPCRTLCGALTIHAGGYRYDPLEECWQPKDKKALFFTLLHGRQPEVLLTPFFQGWNGERNNVPYPGSSPLSVLQIFAEETVMGFLKQWSNEYEDINVDVSVQNEPSTSTCAVFPIQLNQSKPEDSDTMNQLTKVMVNKMMDALSVGSNHQTITKAMFLWVRYQHGHQWVTL